MSTGGYGGAQLLGASGGCGVNDNVGTTGEALAATTVAVAVNLKGASGNTGLIYYQVDGTVATSTNGFELASGEMSGWIPVPGNDLANISVVASVLNEDVFYHYLV